MFPTRNPAFSALAAFELPALLLPALALLAGLCFSVPMAAAEGPFLHEGERSSPVRGLQGMVVTSNDLATAEALAILKRGGNAVDAAVAAGFTLAVTQPESGNLGGGGFMLIASDAKNDVVAIDYRETAPAAARADMFLTPSGEVDTDASRFSHRAAGVPGTVAGLLLALERHGSLSRREVLAGAIRLAEEGFTVSDLLADGLRLGADRLQRHAGGRALFFRADGMPLQAGERFVQKDLAATLRRIAELGAAGFYEGRTADLLVAEMARGGGLITHEDLRAYRAIEREPLRGSYRGHDVWSMGPPSSGGVHLLQILNILEGYPLAEAGLNSARSIHLMAEAMRRAYADRSLYPGDTDFVAVPLRGLLAKGYAEQLRAGIDPERATPSVQVRPGNPLPYESDDTTHFSIVDRFGNAVSNTYTINFSYGSHIVVEGAGFLLNNEMDDFSAKTGAANAYGLIGSDANRIEPGKRMLSSMAPTIVRKDGRNFLVTGSPGGPRIITTTLQVILNVIDHGLNVQSAVNEPRVHHQWLPDEIRIEQGISPDTVTRLEQMGHKVVRQAAMGAIQSVLIDGQGVMHGAADPRRSTSSAQGF